MTLYQNVLAEVDNRLGSNAARWDMSRIEQRGPWATSTALPVALASAIHARVEGLRLGRGTLTNVPANDVIDLRRKVEQLLVE